MVWGCSTAVWSGQIFIIESTMNFTDYLRAPSARVQREGPWSNDEQTPAAVSLEKLTLSTHQCVSAAGQNPNTSTSVNPRSSTRELGDGSSWTQSQCWSDLLRCYEGCTCLNPLKRLMAKSLKSNKFFLTDPKSWQLVKVSGWRYFILRAKFELHKDTVSKLPQVENYLLILFIYNKFTFFVLANQITFFF